MYRHDLFHLSVWPHSNSRWIAPNLFPHIKIFFDFSRTNLDRCNCPHTYHVLFVRTCIIYVHVFHGYGCTGTIICSSTWRFILSTRDFNCKCGFVIAFTQRILRCRVFHADQYTQNSLHRTIYVAHLVWCVPWSRRRSSAGIHAIFISRLYLFCTRDIQSRQFSHQDNNYSQSLIYNSTLHAKWFMRKIAHRTSWAR